MEISAKPVYDDMWRVVLWDMFVQGEWLGSRRTMKQVEMHFRFLGLLDE